MRHTTSSRPCGRVMSKPALRLVRLPGEFGLILRCYGELSVATAEALRRELAVVEALNHPVVMLNLAGCEVADATGMVTVFQSLMRLREKRRRLIIITGVRELSRLLGVGGIEKLIPSFSTEEAAALVLRGWRPPPPGPRTWEEARSETIVHWKVVREALDQAPQTEVLQLLTCMTGLCERAEELYQVSPAPETPRCLFCPFFHALGGAPGDVGCRSRVDPILAAVRSGDHDAARAGIAAVIRVLEEMPLPVDPA